GCSGCSSTSRERRTTRSCSSRTTCRRRCISPTPCSCCRSGRRRSSTASRFRRFTSAICRSSRSRNFAMWKSSCSIYYIASNERARVMASDDKPRPPYAKYAFKNPYNYAVMGGFASAALLTGNWWLGLAGAGAEAIWMLFAPDSRLLRKLWFDKRHQEDQDAARKAELDAKFKLLPEPDAMRCLALREKQEQINKLAQENPAFTIDLLPDQLKKHDELV